MKTIHLYANEVIIVNFNQEIVELIYLLYFKYTYVTKYMSSFK